MLIAPFFIVSNSCLVQICHFQFCWPTDRLYTFAWFIFKMTNKKIFKGKQKSRTTKSQKLHLVEIFDEFCKNQKTANLKILRSPLCISHFRVLYPSASRAPVYRQQVAEEASCPKTQLLTQTEGFEQATHRLFTFPMKLLLLRMYIWNNLLHQYSIEYFDFCFCV